MLVDVVELYEHGLRRPREDVRASLPVRAELSIDRMLTDQGLDRPMVHAHLVPFSLEPLYRCRVEYWRGRNVVLSGEQRAEVAGRKTEMVEMYASRRLPRTVASSAPAASA